MEAVGPEVSRGGLLLEGLFRKTVIGVLLLLALLTPSWVAYHHTGWVVPAWGGNNSVTTAVWFPESTTVISINYLEDIEGTNTDMESFRTQVSNPTIYLQVLQDPDLPVNTYDAKLQVIYVGKGANGGVLKSTQLVAAGRYGQKLTGYQINQQEHTVTTSFRSEIFSWGNSDHFLPPAAWYAWLGWVTAVVTVLAFFVVWVVSGIWKRGVG